MPTYDVPGVYIQEITGPGVIVGVSTSTTAFIGPASAGPLMVARPISSWDQFCQIYGVPQPDGSYFPYLTSPRWFYMAHGVRSFFQNGGAQAYVVRVGTAANTTWNINDQDATTEAVFRLQAQKEGVGGDSMKIAVSAVVLSNNVARISDLNSAYDSELLEDNKPLVIRGMQIFPSATNHFKKTDAAAAYIEVYDPLLLGEKPPQIGLEYRIVNVKTGEQKLDIGYTDTKDSIKPGNPSVPVGLKLPLDTLTPGSYRVDLRAQDSIGNGTEFRSVEFEVE